MRVFSHDGLAVVNLGLCPALIVQRTAVNNYDVQAVLAVDANGRVTQIVVAKCPTEAEAREVLNRLGGNAFRSTGRRAGIGNGGTRATVAAGP